MRLGGALLQACLSAAFLVEGLLFAFHLEGLELNWKAHLLLVMTIFAAVGVIFAEIKSPGNALLGVARAQLVLLQGVWFMQIAKLLFEGEPSFQLHVHKTEASRESRGTLYKRERCSCWF